MELPDLCFQNLDVLIAGKRDDAKIVRIVLDNFQGLNADRPGGTEQIDIFHPKAPKRRSRWKGF